MDRLSWGLGVDPWLQGELLVVRSNRTLITAAVKAPLIPAYFQRIAESGIRLA